MPSDHDHERTPLLPSSLPSDESIKAVNVFSLIHSVHDDVQRNIDTALSWEQLSAPDVNFTILRPLLVSYTSTKNPAISESLSPSFLTAIVAPRLRPSSLTSLRRCCDSLRAPP